MIFNIEKFKQDCALCLVGVTKVDGLTIMDLSRLRRGMFNGLSVKKFMIVLNHININPSEYINHETTNQKD